MPMTQLLAILRALVGPLAGLLSAGSKQVPQGNWSPKTANLVRAGFALAAAIVMALLAWGTGNLAGFDFTAIVSAFLEVIAAAAGQ